MSLINEVGFGLKIVLILLKYSWLVFGFILVIRIKMVLMVWFLWFKMILVVIMLKVGLVNFLVWYGIFIMYI